jgi:hypothetical protein
MKLRTLALIVLLCVTLEIAVTAALRNSAKPRAAAKSDDLTEPARR